MATEAETRRGYLELVLRAMKIEDSNEVALAIFAAKAFQTYAETGECITKDAAFDAFLKEEFTDNMEEMDGCLAKIRAEVVERALPGEDPLDPSEVN